MGTSKIEMRLCACGCGGKLPVNKVRMMTGGVQCQPKLFLSGHHAKQSAIKYEPLDLPAPTGFCFCGCGEATTLSLITNARLGVVKGQPNRWIVGHAQRFHVLHPDAPDPMPEGYLYCVRGKHTKPTEEFAPWAQGPNNVGRVCIQCAAEKRELLEERHPGYWDNKSREYQLKNWYGITPEDYDKMLESQGGVCAICKQPETVKLNETVKRLSVDHCHQEGHVRALLCQACNNGIGRFKDDPYLMVTGALFMLNNRSETEHLKEQRELLERFLRIPR